MSGQTGQVVGGVIGAVVGFWFGVPGIGWTVGAALGSSFDKPDGPDPGDLSFNTSAYGKFRPFGYGTHPITPVCFWSTDWVAHENSEGGKGGGSGPVTLTYTRSAAFYLRDCTDGSEILGIRSIANKMTGEVLYYAGDDADPQTIAANAAFATKMRVYTGAADQDPDPLIEATEGWAPAWRGHAYVVIEDLDAGSQKTAIPLEFEIVMAGSAPSVPVYLAPMSIDEGTNQKEVVTHASDGLIYTVQERVWAGDTYDSFAPIYRTYTIDGIRVDEVSPNIRVPGYNVGSYDDVHAVRGKQWAWVANTGSHLMVTEESSYTRIPDQNIWARFTTMEAPAWIDPYYYGIVQKTDSSWAIVRFTNSQVFETPIRNGVGYGAKLVPYDGHLYYKYQDIIQKLDPSDLSLVQQWTISPYASTQANSEIAIFRDRVAVENVSGSVQRYIEIHTLNGDGTTTRIGFINYGFGAVSLPYGLENGLIHSRDKIYYIGDDLLTTAGQTLDALVANLCTRAGFDAAQYDVSALPATSVRAYINTKRTARDWLAQLAQVYGFRMRDSAGVLECIPKGGASVATIPQADMGMGAGEGAPPLQYSRMQGIDLPRSVTVTYSDADNDYLPGSQIFRMQGYPQGSDVSLNLGNHILTAAEALALAEVACKEPHLQRMSWDTALGRKWEALEPGDVVELPVGLAWVRQISRQKGQQSVSFVAEASAVTTASGLPGALAPVTPRRINLVGPTRIELIDAPAITDTHTGPGCLVAAAGYLSGWDGAALYVSKDGGETYDRLLELTEAATIGTAETALADGAVNGWDRSGTVTVRITTPNVALASESLENVLNGANSAILGDEVIKFANVTYLGENRYTLSMLQRGRKGTGWATGTHAAGERFVLLSTAVQRVSLDIDNIGSARLYKAVSYGNQIANASTVSFTPSGVSLKPWPPVGARAYKSGTSWIIKCLERTRFGGELRNYAGIVRDPEWDGWDLEILDGPGGAVVRTVSALTSPTYTYTSAQQTTDFGAAQSAIHFVWYQRSTVIGRGYPTEASA